MTICTDFHYNIKSLWKLTLVMSSVMHKFDDTWGDQSIPKRKLGWSTWGRLVDFWYMLFSYSM